MTPSGGKVVDGTAFYGSIAFSELWDSATPCRPRPFALSLNWISRQNR